MSITFVILLSSTNFNIASLSIFSDEVFTNKFSINFAPGLPRRPGLRRGLLAPARPAGPVAPRRRVLGGPLGDPPLLAPGLAGRVARPPGHAGWARDPPGVGAPAPGQRLYPLGPVGRRDLYGASLLARGLVEEEAQHLLAVPLVGPDEASSVVVDDGGRVLEIGRAHV